MAELKALSCWRGWTGRSPGRVWRGHLENRELRSLKRHNPIVRVGVDAHIDPAVKSVFSEIFGKFAAAQRADRVVGPYTKYISACIFAAGF